MEVVIAVPVDPNVLSRPPAANLQSQVTNIDTLLITSIFIPSKIQSSPFVQLDVETSVLIKVILISLCILPDGYLDTLRSKAFAQRCALDDSRELLRGVDLEFVGVDEGEDGSALLV